jgi:hypothetical protein
MMRCTYNKGNATECGKYARLVIYSIYNDGIISHFHCEEHIKYNHKTGTFIEQPIYFPYTDVLVRWNRSIQELDC